MIISLAAFRSASFAAGWRPADESCTWTVRAQAVETWQIGTTQHPQVHAFPAEPYLRLKVTPSSPRDVHYYVWAWGDEWWSGVWGNAVAQLRHNGAWIAYCVGNPYSPPESASGDIHVVPGDIVELYAEASGSPMTAEALVDLTPEATWYILQQETRSATNGPLTGTVNSSEGAKNMGTFPVTLQPQHGGTLGPPRYSLLNATPPAHGTPWINSTSGTVFAETSLRIRTWDLVVQSENPPTGVPIEVSPLDNNQQGNGPTSFTRTYDTGTLVHLTAPAYLDCRPLDHWDDGWGGNAGSSPTISVFMDGDAIRAAIYQTALARPTLAAEPPFTPGRSNLIAWSAVPGAQGYYLEWSWDSSFPSGMGHSSWSSNTSFMASPLYNGQTYYYRVKCRNTLLQQSGWSDLQNSRQDASPPYGPTAPTDEGDVTSLTTIRFSWAAAGDLVSGVASYDLQAGTTPGGNNAFDGSVGTTRTWTVAGVHGRRYFARARARDNVGNISLWSSNSNGITVDTAGPRLITVVPRSDRLLLVNFDERVRHADQPGDYTCTGNLAILDVWPMNSRQYVLTTTLQQPYTSYTLIVSPTVRDFVGNSLAPPYARAFRGGWLLRARHWQAYR